MSMLGDVVFCVDCDLARDAQVADLDSPPASAIEARPRRMATKRDANGDPLCAGCLDARHKNRRAEFLLHEGRGPTPAVEPSTAQAESLFDARSLAAESALQVDPQAAPRGKSPFVRIMRSRGHAEDARSAPASNRSAQRAGKQRAAKAPAAARRGPKPAGRGAERQFLVLAGEMGFLRAQELLDELKASLQTVTGGRMRS